MRCLIMIMLFRDSESCSNSSDTATDIEDAAPVVVQKGRRNIRHIKELEDLKIDTRIANRNENIRIIRIENSEKKYKEVLGGHLLKDELILDYDFVNNVPLLSVHKALVQQMKDHQKKGIKFMWNACYESLEQIKQSNGSGCIIAHCMGLGKTFQVITLVHTLLTHPETGTRIVLICSPKNTILNWINEFQKWITPDLGLLNIYNPTRFEDNSSRLEEIAKWQANGGVCIINYELMRILLEDDKKTQKFHEFLCNPGPDLVICDEGHVLKNEETKLSKIMSQIRTMRRIILTGTPLQNNLKEYHCMVQFIKPNLLGTRNEFVNMFVNPILNGQYENSLVEDVQLMKERSHILHKKLSSCVQFVLCCDISLTQKKRNRYSELKNIVDKHILLQDSFGPTQLRTFFDYTVFSGGAQEKIIYKLRFDLSILKSFLPEKHEYVISVALTESQIEMYRFYLNNYSAKGDVNWKYNGVALFADYQSLQRIWTHPYTLKVHADKHQEGANSAKKKTTKKRKKKTYEDDSDDESSESEAFRWTRFPLHWWVRFVSTDDLEDSRQSNKLTVLLKVLNECENAGEKILVFSGSLYSLRLIQHFLKRISLSEFENPCLCDMTSTWEEEQDYVVLTGQTSSEDRDRFCQSFNDVYNTRLRLFLISTKAGGMGINLTAANRAILFDVSWNPSHDIQSIFRMYRIGQKRPCYVYRFVACGTMEEKIYERQVAKQSISYRVVDEKQIARHYTQKELLELYLFEPNKENKMKDVEMKDPLLEKIFREESRRIVGIHEHDSLLEHKEEEELQELEKNDAWTAYNSVGDFKNLPVAEKKMLSQLTPESFDPFYLKKVLEREYSEATKAEISVMMTELMPRIKILLESPDFIDIMKRQAFLFHNNRRKQLNMAKRRKTFQNKENKTVDIIDTSKSKPGTSTCDYSESDDSDFLYNIGSKQKKNKAKRKPLKIWGTRNGKAFGSPEKGS